VNSAEISLITKMRSLGAKPNFPDGVTTIEQRRDTVRAALDPVLDVTFAIQNGKRITMAMQFAVAYGEVP
jgi:hypothetical protein